jgi:hypothetical protein
MGIASMVIGIIALVVGFIPLCGTWAVIPAVIGLGLGIADVVVKTMRRDARGMGIAGLVLNTLAIAIIVSYFVFFIESAQQADWQLQQQWPQRIDGYDAGPSPFGPQPGPPGWPGQPDPLGQPQQPMQSMQPMQPMDTDQPLRPDTSSAEPQPVPVRPDPAPSPP